VGEKVMANILTNIYFWMGLAFLFLLLFALLMIFIIIIAKKTHAIVEFKSWISGKPIALFFQENRNVEWKPVKCEAGIIDDEQYGAFIVNERASYIDKRTRCVLLPFDASVAPSINVHAAKLADDLQYIVKDDEEMKKLRYAIAHNLIDNNETISSIRTTVHFGAIKNMLTALIPHAIQAKIEKVIAQRLKGYGKVNMMQVLFMFLAMLGAIIIGAVIIKVIGGK
jgi:hypothetical protein